MTDNHFLVSDVLRNKEDGMTELSTLARARIGLYGCIAHALHDSEELWMDATEIESGGWTARNGDEEDRLYGSAAFEHIVVRIKCMIPDIGLALGKYGEAGGYNPLVKGDANNALEVIRQRLEKSRKLQAEYRDGEAWFAFYPYGRRGDAWYGWGSQYEAEHYQAMENRNRDLTPDDDGWIMVDRVPSDEAQDFDGFNLGDHFAANPESEAA